VPKNPTAVARRAELAHRVGHPLQEGLPSIGRVHPAAGVDLDLPDQAVHHGLEAAAQAVRDGNVVVLSTDTVYGIGADAFNADAVALS